MYNLAVFASFFLYLSIEAGAVVTGIVIIGIIACRGRNSKLKSKVS